MLMEKNIMDMEETLATNQTMVILSWTACYSPTIRQHLVSMNIRRLSNQYSLSTFPDPMSQLLIGMTILHLII